MPDLKLRLILDVSYNTNGIWPEELKANLEYMVRNAMGNGVITGETEATVDEYEVRIERMTPGNPPGHGRYVIVERTTCQPLRLPPRAHRCTSAETRFAIGKQWSWTIVRFDSAALAAEYARTSMNVCERVRTLREALLRINDHSLAKYLGLKD